MVDRSVFWLFRQGVHSSLIWADRRNLYQIIPIFIYDEETSCPLQSIGLLPSSFLSMGVPERRILIDLLLGIPFLVSKKSGFHQNGGWVHLLGQSAAEASVLPRVNNHWLLLPSWFADSKLHFPTFAVNWVHLGGMPHFQTNLSVTLLLHIQLHH